MSDKHYKEQKMLIENFRKWQEGPEVEKEIIQEDIADIYFAIKNFFSFVATVYDIIQLLSITGATLYTIGPYLKIAMYHPKIYKALTSSQEGENETSTAMRAFAVGLREANNAGQFVQEFVAGRLAAADAEGKKKGVMARLKGAVGIAIFMAILVSTSFPVIGAGVARIAPAAILKIRKFVSKGKKKKEEIQAKIQGLPSPEEQEKLAQEIEEEMKELEELEQQALMARELAVDVAEVVTSIKEDPMAIAEKLGVDLSEEDIKNIRLSDKGQEEAPTSKAKKVNIPSTRKKLTPDEIADRKASADASRERRKRASDFTGFSSFNKKK
jgi:hypothetical protein